MRWVERGIPAYLAVSITFGVDKRTYFRWMSAESPSSDDPKCHIEWAIGKGRALLELRLVRIINKQIIEGDGRLAWKFLQYLQPEAYG